MWLSGHLTRPLGSVKKVFEGDEPRRKWPSSRGSKVRKYCCDALYVNFVAFGDVICHLIKAASLTGACCFTNSRALFLG